MEDTNVDNTLIRRFQPKDVDMLVALWLKELPPSHPTNDPWSVLCRKRNQNDDLIFVAECDGKIVGSAMAGYDGIRGWIYNVFVDSESRRQNTGRKLLAEIESVLCGLGCPKVNLQVLASNTQVLEFYERCGYVLEDRKSFGKRLAVDQKLSCDVPSIQVSDAISLSPIQLEDRPAYLQHLNETDEIHARTASLPYPYTELDVDQWLAATLIESVEKDAKASWAIRNEKSELIGSAGLMKMKVGEIAEIGYWLAKPYWNRGIMTQVLRVLCPFAFDHYQLIRIHAKVFASNTGSASVLKKSGFSQEGRLRQHFILDGIPQDVLVFGQLRGETA